MAESSLSLFSAIATLMKHRKIAVNRTDRLTTSLQGALHLASSVLLIGNFDCYINYFGIFAVSPAEVALEASAALYDVAGRPTFSPPQRPAATVRIQKYAPVAQ